MKQTLKVKGMHCKSCAMLITDALDDLGVKSKVDFAKGTAQVEFDEQKVSLAEIKKVIKKEGYEAE